MEKPGHVAQDCEHHAQGVNEVAHETVAEVTSFSQGTKKKLTESRVVRHASAKNKLILAIDIHSCSHPMACNVETLVDSGAAVHLCPSWYGFPQLRCALQRAKSREQNRKPRVSEFPIHGAS